MLCCFKSKEDGSTYPQFDQSHALPGLAMRCCCWLCLMSWCYNEPWGTEPGRMMRHLSCLISVVAYGWWWVINMRDTLLLTKNQHGLSRRRSWLLVSRLLMGLHWYSCKDCGVARLGRNKMKVTKREIEDKNVLNKFKIKDLVAYKKKTYSIVKIASIAM